MQGSGSPVEVYILELSLHDMTLAFSIVQACGWQVVKELDLKLTLGMAESQ